MWHRLSRLAPRQRFWARLVQRTKLRLQGALLHWDRYPQDGTLFRPFCGVVQIRGWALAPDRIGSVEVRCDGELLGTAAIGLRRRDVHESFPYIRGSRHSGFQLVFDTTRVTNGDHELTVLAHTVKGSTGRLAAKIYIKNLATRYDRYRRLTSPNAADIGWMRRNARRLTAPEHW